MIKGEKKEEKEEKKENYYLSERRFGSFQRSFSIPAGVDEDKIEASFSKGGPPFPKHFGCLHLLLAGFHRNLHTFLVHHTFSCRIKVEG